MPAVPFIRPASRSFFKAAIAGLAGTGLFMFCVTTPVDAAERVDAPGRIAPRVARRAPAQTDNPVPDAALDDLNGPAPQERSVRLPAPAAPAETRIVPRISRDDYRAAYYAVPFSLAEHRANPGYRHAAVMKVLTGEYPPPAPAVGPIRPAIPAGGGYGAPLLGNAPARGFPGLAVPGGWSGPPTVGPPPFAFDRFQGVVPTFVNRYQTPRVFLPRR